MNGVIIPSKKYKSFSKIERICPIQFLPILDKLLIDYQIEFLTELNVEKIIIFSRPNDVSNYYTIIDSYNLNDRCEIIVCDNEMNKLQTIIKKSINEGATSNLFISANTFIKLNNKDELIKKIDSSNNNLLCIGRNNELIIYTKNFINTLIDYYKSDRMYLKRLDDYEYMGNMEETITLNLLRDKKDLEKVIGSCIRKGD